MPSDRTLRMMNRLHRLAMRVTGGRIGWHVAGMAVIELTTTGRRSGEQRTTLLTAPLRMHGGYVVVASRGGDDIHPAWFHNLRAEPRVRIAVDGDAPVDAVAHIATPEERADWWPLITDRYRNYAAYQRRTKREIPLVLLTPVG